MGKPVYFQKNFPGKVLNSEKYFYLCSPEKTSKQASQDLTKKKHLTGLFNKHF